MNIHDTVQISDFRKQSKMFLDNAKTAPVYIRRGLEVFELKLIPTSFEVGKEAVSVDDEVDLPFLQPKPNKAQYGMPSDESFEPVIEPFQENA
jgi:hypothetical protein